MLLPGIKTAIAARILCAALLSLVSAGAPAATRCHFNAASAANFGAYDIFSTMPNNSGVGSVTIDCSGGGNNTFDVTLSTGQSNSYASRVMSSGGNRLNYNLYTGADRRVVWGDGHSGSQVMTVQKNKATTLSIFGQIPAGQDVAVGTYGDIIVATVYF
jgi:spore coat protein U-like protein